MNTREIAGGYRLTHWAQIMHERQESGMSIKAYCKQQGFHENVYYYWQRKLREAAWQARPQLQQRQKREKPARAGSSRECFSLRVNGIIIQLVVNTNTAA